MFLALSGPAPAAVAADRIDVRQAVSLALKNNGEIKALREERGVREAGKIKAGLMPNPVLESDLTTGVLTGSSSENTFSLGLSQEFLTMGKRQKRLEVAKKELDSFDHQVANSLRVLSEEVKTTFYDVILAQKKVELAQRAVVLANQLLEVTNERLKAGDIPELEVNLARVEVARSVGRKEEAEREQNLAKTRLITVLGLAPTDAEFVGGLESPTLTLDLPQLKMLALLSRSDLKALESEKAKGDAELDLARAERIPNLTAGIGYQRQNTTFDAPGGEAKARDNLITLKLSVPIPLFDKNQAGVREAQARRGSAETRYFYARQAIEREVEGAQARLASAEKSVSLYTKEILPQLEDNLKLVQEAYRLGEVGILSVLEEQRKFFEINNDYLAALYLRQTALAKMESAVGGELNKETTGGAR